MIKMFKNKAVIGLCILMLGFTYIKSTELKRIEEVREENVVYMNK